MVHAKGLLTKHPINPSQSFYFESVTFATLLSFEKSSSVGQASEEPPLKTSNKTNTRAYERDLTTFDALVVRENADDYI